MIAILKNRSMLLPVIYLIAVLTASWYICYIVEFAPLQFITSDERLTFELERDIRDLLSKNIKQKHDVRFLEIKTAFPMVDVLKIKRIGLDKNHVQIIASEPIYRLGSSFILTRSNEVFKASSFSNATLNKLPVIYLHTSPTVIVEIEPELKNFLSQLPEFVLINYEIHWHSLNQIVLINKQNTSKHILIKHDQILNEDLFGTCDRLVTQYQTHSNKKCLDTIKIDLRFEGQIIVSC